MNMVTPIADADVLCRKARQFLDGGRPGAARPLVAAARALNAPQHELAIIEARLALLEGGTDQALAVLDSAITTAPQDVRLLNARAEIRHRSGDWSGSAADAADAVTHDPANAEAKARLGAALLELGHLPQSVACLAEALAATPGLVFCREALARALEAMNEVDDALGVLIDGIKIKPVQVSLINAALMMVMRRRDFSAVIGLADQARAAGIATAETFVMLGHAHCALGRHGEAERAYQEAMKLAPEDPIIRQFVISVPPADTMMPDETTVRALFEQYASHFDQHAREQHYTVPTLVSSIAARHPHVLAGGTLGPVLDLGCGTGLIASALRDLPLGPCTGVDISPAMLAQARGKHVHADLVECDILAFLGSDQSHWPLILAGDVVPYLGQLPELLTRVRQRLTPDGWFIFSVEALLPDYDGVLPGNGSWALQQRARLVHSEEYVLNCLYDADFRILKQDRCALRQEMGAGVPGLVLTVGRVDA